MIAICLQALDLMKGLILSPRSKLNQIKQGGVRPNPIYVLFVVTLLLTFSKAILKPWNKSFNVFNDQINQLIVILNNPFFIWVTWYLLYICTVFFIDKLSRVFRPSDRKEMQLMLFSLSSIGLVAHAVFYVLCYLVNKDVLTTIATVIYIWNLILVFLAVKVGSSLSFVKTLVVISIPLAIFAVSPFGIWPFMSPYLLFLF